MDQGAGSYRRYLGGDDAGARPDVYGRTVSVSEQHSA